MTEAREDADLATVLAEIQAAVAEKRSAGVYSETLEVELQSHFSRLIARSGDSKRQLTAWSAVDGLEALRVHPMLEASTASRVPGGQLVHKAAHRVVSRQLQSLLIHNRLFEDGVIASLRSVLEMLDEFVGLTKDNLVHELDTLQDRIAMLEARIDVLAAPSGAVDPGPERSSGSEIAAETGYSSLAFDAISRGTRDEILGAYADVADALIGVPGPVLDIGAGRGELVELLGDRHVDAWGTEIDPELIDAGLALGLDVRLEDGLDALRRVEPASLGGVTAIHVIEHLDPSDVFALVEQAHEKLAPGGKLVLETPNPQSLYVYARAFWLDPTHTRPIHPTFLGFLVRNAGFADPVFEWTAHPDDSERMLEVKSDDEIADVLNENVRRLNQLVYAPQNYRVVATR